MSTTLTGIGFAAGCFASVLLHPELTRVASASSAIDGIRMNFLMSTVLKPLMSTRKMLIARAGIQNHLAIPSRLESSKWPGRAKAFDRKGRKEKQKSKQVRKESSGSISSPLRPLSLFFAPFAIKSFCSLTWV
jgi:hypothetical protein